MDQFSKIQNKNINSKNKDEVLYSNDHLEIIQFEDWSVLKERDCIICLPYLVESNQIIIRHEYIPTFKYVDGQEYHATVICGGIEDLESPEKAVIRELEEEAGIVLSENYKLEKMKPLFFSKGCVDKYHPYLIPLNEGDYHEVIAKGDGSRAEKLSKSVKVDYKYINSINSSDLITEYMLMKLKEYLNLSI